MSGKIVHGPLTLDTRSADLMLPRSTSTPQVPLLTERTCRHVGEELGLQSCTRSQLVSHQQTPRTESLGHEPSRLSPKRDEVENYTVSFVNIL